MHSLQLKKKKIEYIFKAHTNECNFTDSDMNGN